MWISTKSGGSAKLFIACTFLLLGSSLGLAAGKGPFLAPESMTGGEPSKLHDVLDAKDSLKCPQLAIQRYRAERSSLQAEVRQRALIAQALADK